MEQKTKGLLGLPKEMILYDLEYTSWEGAQERNWSGANEHREIVEIGAIKIDTTGLTETDTFDIFVKPKINPELSDYFKNLTGISQETVDKEGVPFKTALEKFAAWAGDLPLGAFGRDAAVIEENCLLAARPFPFEKSKCMNMREFFKSFGIPADDYMSSTIVRAFGKEPERRGHLAINDARSVLDALRELAKKNGVLK